jgi:NAD(P) transhydrogenase
LIWERLVFRRDDRRLLGAHIIGEIAGELIHHGQAAIGTGEPIDTFIDRTFNIPTYSETYKYAAYDGLQRLKGMNTTRPRRSGPHGPGHEGG